MPVSFNVKRGLREKTREFARYDELDRQDFRRVMGIDANRKSYQIRAYERDADPTDPDEGQFVIWMSDGTGSGDDGDIMIKITAGGVTKTATLVDFSTV
jgi:hypothetical protein